MELRYLKQENSLYNFNIRKYGCYFLSILRIIEELKNKIFQHVDVEAFYKKLTENNFMLKNCKVLNSDAIFAYFGEKVITSKENINYRLDKNDLPYFISKIKTENKNGHFTLCYSKIDEKLGIHLKI